jgi:hypothetical protein
VTGHPIDLGPGEPVVVPVAWVREDEVPIERFYPGCGVSGRLRLVPDERGAA